MCVLHVNSTKNSSELWNAYQGLSLERTQRVLRSNVPLCLSCVVRLILLLYVNTVMNREYANMAIATVVMILHDGV